MSIFRVGRRDTDWSLDGVERPWPSDRPSISSFLRDAAAANETFFRGLELPDEDWFGLPGMRFSPGLFDQTMMLQDDERRPGRHARADRLPRR
jgi:hypothetical protein